VAHSLAAPSITSRALGTLGILGGAVLVAAFLPFIPWGPDFFNLRLALFNAGAMAIVIALHRRQASVAPALALLAAVPALLANAWHLVMIVIVVSRPGPPGVGDYGPVYMAASSAMWLSDAWFGLVTLRLGVVSRLGPLALTIGSVLPFFGQDQVLAFLGPDLSAIIGPLALAGVALNGLGWIVLGIVVATRRRASKTPSQEVRPEG